MLQSKVLIFFPNKMKCAIQSGATVAATLGQWIQNEAEGVGMPSFASGHDH
jgi:hypothetical protein